MVILSEVKEVLCNQSYFLDKLHDLEEILLQHESTGNYEVAALIYNEIDHYSRIFSVSDNLIEHDSRSLQIEYTLEAVNSKIARRKIARLFDCSLDDLEKIIDTHCRQVVARIKNMKIKNTNGYTA